MATFRLQRFTNIHTLKAIQPSYLLALLEPHKSYFERRGVELGLMNGHELDYEGLRDVLMNPDASAPPKLVDDLYYVDEMSDRDGMDELLAAVEAMPPKERIELDLPPDPTPAGCELQLARTLSIRRRSPFAMRPVTVRREIEAQLLGIIGSARDFLYVENQFVRHMPIVDALLAALARNAELELIMVVPMAPDTVAFDGRTGLDQRYAERLQTRALGRLAEAPVDRVGVFSLVGARAPENGDSSPRATAFGRGIIYLHSKVLIADDQVAHVSSANLNGRSLSMDTELGVEWRDPEAVARFRVALWRAHLGEAAVAGPARPRLADWRRLAEEALFDRDRERPQQVVPYHLSRARRFSRYGFGIPKQYF